MFELNIISTGLCMMSGVCFGVAVHHFFYWLSQREKTYYLIFSLLTLTATFYILSQLIGYNADNTDFYLKTTRWVSSLLIILQYLYLLYLSDFSGFSSKLLLRSMLLITLMVIAVNLFSDSSAFFIRVEALDIKTMPWGETAVFGTGVRNYWFGLIIASQMILFGFSFYCVYKLFKQKRLKRAYTLLIGTTPIVLAALVDSLVDAGVIDFIYLAEFGFLAWIMVMGYFIYTQLHTQVTTLSLTNQDLSREILIRRRVEVKLEKHQEHLEEMVEERTGELVEALDLAESANRAKSVFLAGMSHEIRTPINAILGMINLTLGDELPSKQHKKLSTARDSARHLLAIVNDVLDLSKIEAGRLDLEITDFDLPSLIRTTAETFKAQAKEKGLFLEWHIPLDCPVYVAGDPDRLNQVLFNLLGNALKFTEKGGITLSIRQVPTEKKQSDISLDIPVTFSIKDTGIGIADDVKETIFNRFEQAESDTTRKYGGTGLGLAISRQLVELMGGHVDVISQPGQGSEFIFSVIFKPGVKPLPKLKVSSLKTRRHNSKPVEILLVEDNPVNATVAVMQLKRLGYHTTHADSGRTALSKLKSEKFDLVLMDIEMPEMDGLETTRRIRKGEAGKNAMGLPILAMTAHALSEIKLKCEEAGMNDFITKPIDVDILSRAIDTFS